MPQDGSRHTGIFELSRANSGPIEVDVVAVHGLQGDAFRTWTHDKSQICWLRDLLPDHINNARILTWGYIANTNSLNGKMTSSDRILHHAETLVEELQIDREVSLNKRNFFEILFLRLTSGNCSVWSLGCGVTIRRAVLFDLCRVESMVHTHHIINLNDAQQRPIIFICHSLGGIIVKRALTLSEGRTSAKNARLHSIYICTFGILFFGTPHSGSEKARQANTLMKFASFIVPRKVARFETNLLTRLEDDSETLQISRKTFRK
ncbi:Cytochrome P450 [Penicillium sp. IBT 16267x]|nr:Cytochrome P450 [Penicillium sp. IBT 16267x]